MEFDMSHTLRLLSDRQDNYSVNPACSFLFKSSQNINKSQDNNTHQFAAEKTGAQFTDKTIAMAQITKQHRGRIDTIYGSGAD